MTSNENKNPNFFLGSIPKVYLREQSFIEPTVKNPFSHKLKLKSSDKLKIGVNAVLLLPIRLVCIGFLIGSALFLSTILTCGISKQKINNEPLKGWRKALRKPIKYLGKALRFCCGFHRVKINGKKATKEEATIFAVAPHSSFLDLFIIFDLDFPCAVSKAENADIPVIGKLTRAMQPILVTREDSKNRATVVDEIKKRADPKSGWPQIVIFPEGTCTNRSCLITFKPGAFLPSLPVQPVLIQYKNKFDCTVWTWDGLSVPKIFFYTLCQFNNNMEVTFLPVYVPNEQEKRDVKLYANNVRQEMAKALDLPVTNHSFEDCRLMLLAKKYKFPLDTGLVEFSKIKDKLGLNYENCQSILEKFTKIAKNSSGKIGLKEFANYLELPPDGAVAEVFKLYDRDSNGQVDFREFLIGLSLLSQPANSEETLKIAFQVSAIFDPEGKGFVSLADLQNILYNSFSMSNAAVTRLFDKIDKNKDGLITYDEFKEYAAEKPEYARIFLSYHELKKLKDSKKRESDDDDDQLFLSFDEYDPDNGKPDNQSTVQQNRTTTDSSKQIQNTIISSRTLSKTTITTVNVN